MIQHMHRVKTIIYYYFKNTFCKTTIMIKEYKQTITKHFIESNGVFIFIR